MEGVNDLDARVLPLKPLTNDDNGPSTQVDFHLNNLVASHFSNPDLTPQEIADASRTTAAAAALAAKVARDTADQKAIAAAKAVAAAKTALALIASFPNTNLGRDNLKKHVAADDLLSPNDEELPSNLQLGEISQGIMSSSFPSCEHQNDQCEVPPIGLGERPNNTEHAIPKTVDSNGLGMDLDSNRLNESVEGEGAKEGTQGTRKRGRPKSK